MADERQEETLSRAKDLVDVAEHMERNMGTAGAVILAAMLINEGLHAVAAQIQSAAEAIEKIGDVEGSVSRVANAISAHP